MASTSLAVDMTADFSPSSSGEVTLYMGPHPIIPVVRFDGQGANTLRSWFLSEPFGGGVNSGTASAVISVRDAFNAAVESYRILSQSITCTHLGSSTDDGGGVISSQYVSPYQDLAVSYDSRDQDGVWIDRVAPLARIYQNPPSTSTLLSGGRAYISDARDGVYVPLRLRTLDYESTNNARYLQGNVSQDVPIASPLPYEGAVGWPIFFVPPNGSMVALPNYTSDVFSLTRFTGLKSGVKIRVRLRQVIEVIPYPGTAYAPLVQTPPPPDPLALQMYFEVSARSLDAYPASYNDFNTLMRTITSIANKVLPYVDPVLSALSAVPGAPGAIASALRTVGQAIVRRRKRKKDSGGASSAPPPLPPRPKPKGKKLVVRSPPRPR